MISAMTRGDVVAGHRGQELVEPVGRDLGPLEHEGLLLALVLQGGAEVEVPAAELDHGGVFLEELREVEVLPAVVRLLVEIHRADADLGVLEVRGDDGDVVVAAHVAEEADEAALVELHHLLRHADRLGVAAAQPARTRPTRRAARSRRDWSGCGTAQRIRPVGPGVPVVRATRWRRILRFSRTRAPIVSQRR